MAHTPGPWSTTAYSSVVGLPVCAQPDPKKNTIIICGVRGDRNIAEANAKLIAAAPDLLEAAKVINARLASSPVIWAVEIAQMRAAIAKAEAA